jgi:hypothetical protein
MDIYYASSHVKTGASEYVAEGIAFIRLSAWNPLFQIWYQLYSTSQPPWLTRAISCFSLIILAPSTSSLLQDEVCLFCHYDLPTRQCIDTSVPAIVRSVFIIKYMPWETTEVGRRSSSTKRLAMAPLASFPGSVPPVTEERSSLSQRCVTDSSAASLFP